MAASSPTFPFASSEKNPWNNNSNNNEDDKMQLNLQPSSSVSSSPEMANANGKKGIDNAAWALDSPDDKKVAQLESAARLRGNNNGTAGPVKSKMAESWGEMIRAWPKTTLCIVSNEFCERFSYYGMRTVLTLYLLNVLKFNGDASTMFFNGFTVLCYLTPLLGSILADGYIGKFKTIFFVSILYTFGQIVLALASTQGPDSGFHPWLDLLGLAIIGFGTGGIKPCVSAFGGDQFESHQEKMLVIYFSMFYFSINAGSMISTFISPIFRATPCLAQDSCYPMAFGVPAILMIIATLTFMAGSFWYKKPMPRENIFGEVYRVSKKAVANKWRSQISNAHSHWLDYFFDTHFCAYDPKCRELQLARPGACAKRQFVADLKSLLRLLVMYLPAPMFWALYDQQGSRWMIQSVMMDCRLWGDTLLLPDQMQTLNAVLILVFIPIFQVVIYPLWSCFFRITPLRKMVIGGFVAALAFVVSAGVQFRVNTTLPDLPGPNHAFLSVINGYSNCSLTVCSPSECHSLQPNGTLTNLDRQHPEMFNLPASAQTNFQIAFNGAEECPTGNWSVDGEFASGGTFWMLVSNEGVILGEANTKKPTQGTGEFSIGITLAMDKDYNGNLALCRKPKGELPSEYPCNPQKAEDFYVWQIDDNDFVEVKQFQQNDNGNNNNRASIYKFKPVRPGDWSLYYMKETPKRVGQQTLSSKELHVNSSGIELSIRGQGGVYMLALTGTMEKPEKRVFQVVADNSVSILWQVPQIVIITAAEILFSITGNEFAYSQAAPSMKSLVQALWLLTVALGDSIIVLITLIKFPNMAVEFLFYAAMMAVVTVVLALLAIFYYKYKKYVGLDSENDDTDNASNGGESGGELCSLKPGAGGISSSSPTARASVQMYGSNDAINKILPDNGNEVKHRGHVNPAFGGRADGVDGDNEKPKRF